MNDNIFKPIEYGWTLISKEEIPFCVLIGSTIDADGNHYNLMRGTYEDGEQYTIAHQIEDPTIAWKSPQTWKELNNER